MKELKTQFDDKWKLWMWESVKNGTPKKEIYDRLIKEGFSPFHARQELNWSGDDCWVCLSDKKYSYPLPQLNIQLKESALGGFGVFATIDFEKDDVIEYCRVLTMYNSDLSPDNVLRDYIHSADPPSTYYDPNNQNSVSYLMLGYGDLYNHSDYPNTRNEFADLEGQLMAIIANRSIKAGEEILANYGPSYWEARQKKPE